MKTILFFLIAPIVATGIILTHVSIITPKFNRGDCVQSRTAESWDNAVIYRIKKVGKKKYLYEYNIPSFGPQNFIQLDDLITVMDSENHKVDCPVDY